jgi:hypothetical protein
MRYAFVSCYFANNSTYAMGMAGVVSHLGLCTIYFIPHVPRVAQRADLQFVGEFEVNY